MMSSDADIIILPSTTAAASSTGSVLNVPGPFSRAIVFLNVTAASGTSETLDVYVQEQLTPAGANDLVLAKPTGTAAYDDFIHFTQVTTSTGLWVARIGPSASNVVAAKKDASLAAATVANGPIGSIWRVKYVIGGTNPSYTFSVTARLLP